MIDIEVDLCRGRLRLSVQLRSSARVVGIFGPSGAGKTTLLEVIGGLVAADRGRVEIDGETYFDTGREINVFPAARRAGWVFQDLRLFPHRSVRGNLLYGRRRAIDADGAFSLDEIVDALDLGALLRGRVLSLSGGERQRVAIARALLSAPRVLLLDEPLTALDDRLKGRVLDLLRRARDEHGTKILYVSHSLWEIQELTDDVVFVDAGAMIGAGRLTDVLGNERAFALASRLGLENLLEVEIVGHEPSGDITLARLGDARLVLPRTDLIQGSRGRVSIRPGDIVVARAPVEGLSVRNVLRGQVKRMTPVGSHWLLGVDIGAEVRVEVTRASIEELGIMQDSEVWLLAKTFAFSWRP